MSRTPTSARWTAEAIAWVVALSAVLYFTSWHDSVIRAYWAGRFDKGSLFSTQRRSRGREAPSPEPVRLYPAWISLMRYEADLSVGLLAASAGMILVDGVRRLRVRRVWAEPGAVSCVVAVAAMGLCILEEASWAAKEHRGLWGRVSNPFPNAWPHCELRISLAVLGAWLIMAASGRWRPRRAWADRVGLAVGSSWLVVMVYRMVAPFFIPFNNWGY